MLALAGRCTCKRSGIDGVHAARCAKRHVAELRAQVDAIAEAAATVAA